MHPSVMQFFAGQARPDEFRGKVVLEVGSFNVNGGVRDDVMKMEPNSYIGTDMRHGPGVDMVVPADQLVDVFGAAAFDVVISTEMLEHAEDWRAAIYQMKNVLRSYGLIYLTARGPGFPLHDFPGDYWRFTVDHVRAIFADFEILVLTEDTDKHSPGFFLKARKRDTAFSMLDLTGIEVCRAEQTASYQKAW